ncbi:MAG: hypothetical protein ABIW49_10040 [Knoellia sp.]
MTKPAYMVVSIAAAIGRGRSLATSVPTTKTATTAADLRANASAKW